MSESVTFAIPRAEPDDDEAVQRVYAGQKAIWGTLQLPFPSVEVWRKRLTEPPEGMFGLVACAEDEAVGHLGLHTYPNSPRRRHVGHLGMAVRDEWHGKGVGSSLMQAAVDLADKWLNLSRLELDVYADNEPAVRLYKNFGFGVEGTLSRFAYRDGQYVDAYLMARLRPINP